MLTDLAAKFKTASQDGTMPDLKPKGGHGNGPMGPPPGPPPDDSSSSSTSSTDSSSSSTASKTSSSLANYTKLLSQIQDNTSNNPMATLEGILKDVLSATSTASS